MDLNRFVKEDENACPGCGAQVAVTGETGEAPVKRQTGRCPAGHEVERHTGLEQTAWILRSS
jgi:hypothetical protein